MAFQTTILSRIVRLVNRREFQNQVSAHNGDYKVSSLTCFRLLVAMIFTHLRSNRTIRDIVLGFEAAMNKLYHLGRDKPPKRSTISDSLANRPARVFEDYYRSILSSLNRKEKARDESESDRFDDDRHVHRKIRMGEIPEEEGRDQTSRDASTAGRRSRSRCS
jgi:hypothetical protein